MNLDSCFVLLALGWMEFILNRWKYNIQSGVFLNGDDGASLVLL